LKLDQVESWLFAKPIVFLIITILAFMLSAIFLADNSNFFLLFFIDFLIVFYFIFWFFVGNFDNAQKLSRSGLKFPIITIFIFIFIPFFTGKILPFITNLIRNQKLYIIWSDIPIVIGAVTLLFCCFYLVYRCIKDKKLDGSLIKNTKFLRFQDYFFIISLLTLFLLVFSPLIINSATYSTSEKDSELSNLVTELTKTSSNDIEKTKDILKWFDRSSGNIADIWYKQEHDQTLMNVFEQLYIFSDPLTFCSQRVTYGPEYGPVSIYNAGCGRCGEFAILFMEMAKRANLTVKRMTCSGENHEWNEVWISEEKRWQVVDSTAVDGTIGFVDYDFMEAKVAGDSPTGEGNVCYVYARYSNDPNQTECDETVNYTKLTQVIICTNDTNGNPVSNITVKVISNNRDQPRYTNLYNITNEEGYCTFTIGGGDCTFKAENNENTLSGEITKKFEENIPKHVYLISLEKNKTEKKQSYLIPIILIILSLIILLSTIYLNKRKRSSKIIIKIIKLIFKGIFNPRWTFTILFTITLLFLTIGILIDNFQTKVIFSLGLQAVGVILISLWNLWPNTETKTKAGLFFSTLFGGSVGPALISFTNAVGVGMVLSSLFIQLTELVSWFPVVFLAFCFIILLFRIKNWNKNI